MGNLNSIREALNDANFDWSTGRVFKTVTGEDGLTLVPNDDECLNDKGGYYALDETFVYMSAFVNFFGEEQIFPGKARIDSVGTIGINIEKYFEGNSLKDVVLSTIGSVEIVSMQDIHSPEGLPEPLYIVGSVKIPFFVCSMGEKAAISLFLDRTLYAARLSVLEQTMERQMLGFMLSGEGSQF